MQEQQNLTIQPAQLVKSNQESAVNLRINQEDSFQAENIQEQSIPLTKKSITEAAEQNFPLSHRNSTILKSRHSLQKLPKVLITELPRDQQFYKQKYQQKRVKTLGSQKKLNNKSSTKQQQISRDIAKHPMKYKIVQQLYNCKPKIIYELKPAEIDLIQEENMKMKGLNYLRQSLERTKSYEKMRSQKLNRLKEASEKKLREKQEKAQKTRKQKLLELVEKEQNKGNLVFKRVKNHLVKGQAGFFAHLSSSESVDKAFVSFLKTKIKRAEVTCKL